LSHGHRPSMTLMESYWRAGVMLVSAETRAERVRACIVATRGRESRDTGAQGGASAQAAGTSTGPHVAHESGDLSVGLGSRPRRTPGVAVRTRDCTHNIVSVSVGQGEDARITRRSGHRTRPCGVRTPSRVDRKSVRSVTVVGDVWTDGSGSGAAGRAPRSAGPRQARKSNVRLK
jgi:hypothetical protein